MRTRQSTLQRLSVCDVVSKASVQAVSQDPQGLWAVEWAPGQGTSEGTFLRLLRLLGLVWAGVIASQYWIRPQLVQYNLIIT